MNSGRKGIEYARYMGPLLDALRQLGESAHRLEAEERVAELMAIPPEELERRYAKTGARIVQRNMEWAASGLRFLGFIGGAEKGVWTLTEAGRHKQLSLDEANDLARKWNAHRRELSLAGRASGPGPTEATEVEDELEEPATESAPTLLQVLKSLSPEGFERLSQLLLRQAGFSKVMVTGRSSDGGIDGHGILEINELVSFQVLFQCKRYSGAVGSGAVRDFRGAMTGRTDKGIIITTGTFSAEAEKEALRDGAPPVELVDGERLVEMMQRLQLGVEPVIVYAVDYAFFEPYM
ncbi:MAG: restriction endonuclease [Methanoregulaceae archaeon]|nr:restriction endonuclease [Methanoregulaceae archaeon]